MSDSLYDVDFFDGYGTTNNPQKIVSLAEEKSLEEILENYPFTHYGDNQNERDGLVSGSQKTKTELDALFDELNSLVGLELAKSEVNQLIQFVKIQNIRRQKGLGATSLSLHSVFYGNPGTGKTTVARIYGKMLHAIGLLSKGHLVETDRSGLVANYIGQTANKTNEKIDDALGGVLFIDEAYSLYRGERSEWDFGSEAIEILLKRMEDNRNDLAVIVAGYPEPMEEFLSSNEGFKSRFANFVHFEDFSPEELASIFLSFCGKNNYVLHNGAYDAVNDLIGNAYNTRNKSFGNARFCRNMFEKIIRNQAMRIGKNNIDPTEDQLREITKEDIYL